MSRRAFMLAAVSASALALCAPEGVAGGGGFDPIPPEDITWTDETPIMDVPEAWRARVADERLVGIEPIPEAEVTWSDDADLADIPDIWRERVALERAASAPDVDEDSEGHEEVVPSAVPASEASAATVRKAAAAAEKDAPKPRRQKRGPPADGEPEKRVAMILTTSKLSSATGSPLRRGTVVMVPERRIEGLERQGRIRAGSTEELEIAERRHGKHDLA